MFCDDSCCFTYQRQAAIWPMARQACMRAGGDLVRPDNFHKLVALEEYFRGGWQAGGDAGGVGGAGVLRGRAKCKAMCRALAAGCTPIDSGAHRPAYSMPLSYAYVTLLHMSHCCTFTASMHLNKRQHHHC
jgi:hypothetical protein